MRQILRADVVAAQAEIFLVNGDINSNLYTSTRAMHSAILGLLQVEHPLHTLSLDFFAGYLGAKLARFLQNWCLNSDVYF